ncbi:unnamed protein product [Lactuca saligna]|uniref:DNA-directed RNA polymerase n=1 Tax=Lactuca saligna TaxID=75948 RepID=A0AA35YPZ6_LACSI|nr:unnamed protein product [Lactuca saligna]
MGTRSSSKYFFFPIFFYWSFPHSFYEHNDVNRALMSSNMQCQAVPLSQSENCIVGTGLEGQATLDSGALAIDKNEGDIIYTDTDKILLSVGGELALGKNVLVAYMPWEGYNFEDAVLISKHLVYEDIYTSFHIRKYGIQINQGSERITNEIPHLEVHLLQNLEKNGIATLGSWVEKGDILVGKLTSQMVKESSYAPEDRLLRTILGMWVYTSKETCLKLPIGGRGRVIDVRWVQSSKTDETEKTERVPSRMNVGIIFESSLGLAGGLLDRHYQIAPFDERYEQEASTKLLFSELYEARNPFEQPVIIGKPYILKLIHQVDDKIHRRSNGRYSRLAQQPLKGRVKKGGQWVGEMEVCALEGFGIAYILQEMLTYKSDHIRARQEVLGTMIFGGRIPTLEDAPESFRLFV